MPKVDANIHVDVFLTDAAAGYKNDAYIAESVLPIIPVTKETGQVAAYGTDHYRLDGMTPRAYGSNAARVDWSTAAPVTFTAKEWTLEHPVDDRQAAMYDDPFNAYSDGSTAVAERILLKREDLVATLMSTSGNFGSTTSGNAWGTPGTGLPVTQIRAAMLAIVQRSGVSPANLYGCCSYLNWNRMIQTTELKTLYLNTIPGGAAPGNVSPSMIAKAIGLQDIYVGSAVKITSKEGAASDVFADVWSGSTFAVFYKAPRPTLMTPSYGAIVSPTVPGFPGRATIAVDRYRDEPKRSWIVRGTALYDQITVNKNMGQLITGIT